jgi:hypothetical protein
LQCLKFDAQISKLGWTIKDKPWTSKAMWFCIVGFGKRKRKNRERLEGSGSGPWTLVLKRFYATNIVRHVLAFRRVCSYHGVYSFVFL